MQKRRTRARLVDAALEEFNERGYAATTIENISAAAGVTRATFYLHFESKADVVRELLAARRDAMVLDRQRLTEAVAASDPASLRAWLESAFKQFEAMRAVGTTLEDAVGIDAELRSIRMEGFSEWIGAIAEGLKNRDLNQRSRNIRGHLAYSQLDAIFFKWLRSDWQSPDPEMLSVMTAMWHTAFTYRHGTDGRLDPPSTKRGNRKSLPARKRVRSR
jgi:AcrR family transcriptional regulator